MKLKVNNILFVIFGAVLTYGLYAKKGRRIPACITMFFISAGMDILCDRDFYLLGKRAQNTYITANKTAVFCLIGIVFLTSSPIGKSGFYTGISLLLNAVIFVCILANYHLWWENIRKTLFMDKVVNPFETEFLISFGLKKELQKFFDVMRNTDKKRHGKHIVFMCIVPVMTICIAMCIVAGLLLIAVKPDFAHMLCIVCMLYEIFTLCFLWHFSIHSSKRFFKVK